MYNKKKNLVANYQNTGNWLIIDLYWYSKILLCY